MRVEFGELRIGEKARKNLMHCVDNHWASGGEKVKEFEDKWGQLLITNIIKLCHLVQMHVLMLV